MGFSIGKVSLTSLRWALGATLCFSGVVNAKTSTFSKKRYAFCKKEYIFWGAFPESVEAGGFQRFLLFINFFTR